MEKCDLFFYGAGKVDEGRIERFDATFGQIFQKTAESDEVIALSQSREAFVVLVVFKTVELQAIFSEHFGSDVFWFEFARHVFGAEFKEAIKI